MSPNGTRIPPAASITDTAGVVWTIGNGQYVCRNGVRTNGRATQLLWWTAFIYAKSPRDGVWWKWLGNNLWQKLTLADPQVVAPPTPLPGTSPDGTTVPNAVSIIASDGAVWKLEAPYATDLPNKVITRNGIAIDRGVLLVYQGGIVWFQYSHVGVLEWWKWDGTKTVLTVAGPPGFYMAPVFSFPDPLSLSVGVPVSLAPFVSSLLPLVFTGFDTPQASLTADGKFTQKVEGSISNTIKVNDGH